MNTSHSWRCVCLGAVLLFTVTLPLPAEVQVRVDHRPPGAGSGDFSFANVPRPRRADAGATAKLTLVDGQRDGNGAALEALVDGRLPTEDDEPGANFFFAANTDGGRLLLDLGRKVTVGQVNTFSWHPSGRGPQVYELYASDGTADGFNAQPRRGTDPVAVGWQRVARVNTRPASGERGGQYGVSLAGSDGPLGQWRYLLFDVARTDSGDAFANTFFSEFDVVEHGAPAEPEPSPATGGRETFATEDGKYRFTFVTTDAPDLAEWARTELKPVVLAWYPKLVAMLPSEGYTAPDQVTLVFRGGMGGTPASASGARVNCNREWFRNNLRGEARGSVVHELVHVVQQYGRAPRNAPRPGWLVEGIADYVRWFRYEPETRGAEITRRNLERARYDASYRVTGNFLNWVSGKYDSNLVTQLNAALRQGTYTEEMWQKRTGHTVQELGTEWRAALEQRLGAAPAAAERPAVNALTPAETAAGWRLLFNGRDFTGWHNFKRTDVRPGWQVRDGVLVCADPKNAGDLVTAEEYGWFELELEYNISEAGNSGIIYHVSDAGSAAWASGPEFQLEDNAKAKDPQRCGWLYGLYQPPDDPSTGQPLDATKPAGEWNRVRLVLSPERCEHWINGVKYFDYVLGSEDFKARVARSKFGRMPLFAQTPRGRIALQGDHGEVSFRNLKLRPLPAAK
jgi:hypothetical protein